MYPYTRNISAGVNLATVSDYHFTIDASKGAVTIILPKLTNYLDFKSKNYGASLELYSIRYKDAFGNAAINNITFLCQVGDFINGQSSFVLNTNGASGMLFPTSQTDWVVVSSFSTSTPAVIPVYYNESNGVSIPSDVATDLGAYLILDSGKYIFDIQVSWTKKTGLNPFFLTATANFLLGYSYTDLDPNNGYDTWVNTPIINSGNNFVIATGTDDKFAGNFNINTPEITLTQKALIKSAWYDPSGNTSFLSVYNNIRAIKTDK